MRSRAHGYAGTMDWLARIAGHGLVLGDIKTKPGDDVRDTFTTTVEAAAAWAREDPYDDRPTLAELAGEDAPRCSVCGLRPTWDDEGDPCDDCEAEA